MNILKYREKNNQSVKTAGQELTTYLKKTKLHTEKKPCVTFGCELYFDV
jgi:hypothetical protein